MTDDPRLLDLIRTQIRNEIVVRYNEVLSLSPPETPYAALLEISDQCPDIWPIVASEEALSRLAEEHMLNGYTVEGDRDAHQTIRAALRWDAPGEYESLWYDGNRGNETELTAILGPVCTMPDDYRDLQLLAIGVLREMSDQGVFGDPKNRGVFIGITNVDDELHEFLDDNRPLNPPSVITEFEQNMESNESLWAALKPPPAT